MKFILFIVAVFSIAQSGIQVGDIEIRLHHSNIELYTWDVPYWFYQFIES